MQYDKIELGRTPITLLLKGLPGTGKTWKAAHFPSPVVFNFDNNLSGLRKLPDATRNGVKVVNPRFKDGKQLEKQKVWDHFIKLLEEVVTDKEVKTVIIDSLTTLAEVLVDKILNSGSPEVKMQIQHWGDFQRYMKWLGEEFLCAKDLDKHVVFIAHEQMERDELSNQVIYTLNMGSRLKNSFDLYFTDCWRCFTRSGDKTQFLVRVMPGSNFNAKCSLALPEQFEWDKEVKNVLSQL